MMNRQTKNKRKWGAPLAMVAATLSACSVGPEYVRPEQPLPQTFHAASQEQAALPAPASRWWMQFGSSELNALVDEALSNNPDVRAAMHRIAEAEAKAGIEAGALLPYVQASGGHEAARKSKNNIGASNTTLQHLDQVRLEASYEIDLWGKNRSAMEAAMATAHASIYDRETVAMTLVSDVVSTYLQYLQGVERVEVAKHNVENLRRVLDKVVERTRIGEGNELEVQQQSTALHAARANVPLQELLRDQQYNRLAFLLGKGPGELKVRSKSLSDFNVPEIGIGVPSDLLLRRPDIRKAEANLVAANANIGMARAKLFPSLTLSADRGWSSSDFTTLTSPASIVWTLAGKMAQPLFDNGKTNSEIAFYQARWSELADVYRQAILASLRDVEDALAQIRHYKTRDAAQADMLKTAREAYRMSQHAFSIGISDYLTVLETERALYNAEDGMIQSSYARLASAVALFKALGGGTQADAPPAPQPAPQPTKAESGDEPKAADPAPREPVDDKASGHTMRNFEPAEARDDLGKS